MLPKPGTAPSAQGLACRDQWITADCAGTLGGSKSPGKTKFDTILLSELTQGYRQSVPMIQKDQRILLSRAGADSKPPSKTVREANGLDVKTMLRHNKVLMGAAIAALFILWLFFLFTRAGCAGA